LTFRNSCKLEFYKLGSKHKPITDLKILLILHDFTDSRPAWFGENGRPFVWTGGTVKLPQTKTNWTKTAHRTHEYSWALGLWITWTMGWTRDCNS